MRGTARETEIPGNDIPGYSTAECGKDDRIVYNGGIDDAGTYGIGDMDSNEENSGKLEEGRPNDGILRGEDPGRYNSRNCISGVMEAVEKIKDQGYED